MNYVDMLLLLILLLTSIIDIKTRQVPYSTYVGILALCVLNKNINIIGAIIVMLPYLIVALKNNKLGGGDVKLMFCIGLYFDIIEGLYISLVALLSFVVVHIFMNKKKDDGLPFVPFVLIGTLVNLCILWL